MKAATVPAVVLLGCWAAMATADHLIYHNDRFGLRGALPIGFRADPPPANGDGRLFRNPQDSARLRIYGAFPLSDDLTAYKRDLIAQYEAEGTRITYRAGGADWFVLSGQGGDRTLYLRVQQAENCDGDTILAHWQLRYAAADAGRYEDRIAPLARQLSAAPCS